MFRMIEYKAYLFNPITYRMREKPKGANCKTGGEEGLAFVGVNVL